MITVFESAHAGVIIPRVAPTICKRIIAGIEIRTNEVAIYIVPAV